MTNLPGLAELFCSINDTTKQKGKGKYGEPELAMPTRIASKMAVLG